MGSFQGHPDLVQLQNARRDTVALGPSPAEEDTQGAVGAGERLRLDEAAAEAGSGGQLGPVLADQDHLQVLEAPDLGMGVGQP